jgi:hypothetical protein
MLAKMKVSQRSLIDEKKPAEAGFFERAVILSVR